MAGNVDIRFSLVCSIFSNKEMSNFGIKHWVYVTNYYLQNLPSRVTAGSR